jgi:hypothetical protein
VRRRRAALVLMRGEQHQLVEWALLLEFCVEHHCTPTAVTRSPMAAVALGMAGLVEVIVAPTADVQRILVNAACPVEFVRPVNLRESREAKLILSMLSRGGTPATISQLLDLPLNLVLDVQRSNRVLLARQRTPAERAKLVEVLPAVDGGTRRRGRPASVANR